jgi:predicted Ser/Thr protein kinase
MNMAKNTLLNQFFKHFSLDDSLTEHFSLDDSLTEHFSLDDSLTELSLDDSLTELSLDDSLTEQRHEPPRRPSAGLASSESDAKSFGGCIISLATWLEDQYGVPSYATLAKWKYITTLKWGLTPKEGLRVVKNEVKLKDFKPLKLIGTGHYGKVFLVDRCNKLFALKVVEKVDRKCFDEFAALKKLGTSNLTSRLHFCFDTSKAMYFVMDFAQGGDLFTYNHRNNITESNIRLIASSVVQALQHIHSNGIIYRDLKLENVLLTKTGHVMLSDFGLCSFHDVSTGFCGTRPYIAPEIYNREEYTNKVDSYSLGVMLVELMGDIQDPPTDEKYAPPTISHYRQQRFSNILVDLVNKLIEKDPNKRLSIAQIKYHPFFKNIKWELVEQHQYDGLPIECTSSKDVANFDNEFTDVCINEFKHLFNKKKVILLFP